MRNYNIWCQTFLLSCCVTHFLKAVLPSTSRLLLIELDSSIPGPPNDPLASFTFSLPVRNISVDSMRCDSYMCHTILCRCTNTGFWTIEGVLWRELLTYARERERAIDTSFSPPSPNSQSLWSLLSYSHHPHLFTGLNLLIHHLCWRVTLEKFICHTSHLCEHCLHVPTNGCDCTVHLLGPQKTAFRAWWRTDSRPPCLAASPSRWWRSERCGCGSRTRSARESLSGGFSGLSGQTTTPPIE